MGRGRLREMFQMGIATVGRRGLLAGVAGVFLFATTSFAPPVSLDAYVLNPIYGCDGVTPLADGSWVMIIGSGDNVINPMQTWGPGYFIADSVTGDDIILAIVPIDSLFGSGTFGVTITYDSSLVNYVYIRYFDTTNWPIGGTVCWGTSKIFAPTVYLGVAEVRFDPDGSLYSTNVNNFVAIPEPSTANLLVLVGGMILAIRASTKRQTGVSS
ncbi:MAG: hypothetical protein NZ740_06540 [Kiritimatiellae bacterium]|nr:hypothetical protein [Kiritimatiellia bacterium]MDW8458754.1 hypothetical protein [Verrucomicrobiota bacterium]